MTVIVELVFFDNLVIDFLLLKTTYLISGKGYKTSRIVLVSVFGAVIALFYPLIKFKGLILVLLKLLVGGLLLLLSNGFSYFKEFYYNYLIFLGLTFLSGGGIYFAIDFFGVQNTAKYTAFFVIIPVFFIITTLSKLIKLIYNRKTVVKNLFDVEFSLRDNKITSKGFYDTGNLLYHDGLPVCIIDQSLIEDFYKEINFLKNLEKIEVSTINGKKQKGCFLVEKTSINGKIKGKAYFCISKVKDLSGYRIILHPDLVEGDCEGNIEENNRIAT